MTVVFAEYVGFESYTLSGLSIAIVVVMMVVMMVVTGMGS